MQDEGEANRGGLQIPEAAVRESKRRESKAYGRDRGAEEQK